MCVLVRTGVALALVRGVLAKQASPCGERPNAKAVDEWMGGAHIGCGGSSRMTSLLTAGKLCESTKRALVRAQDCFDDARLCRSGELLVRSPALDCAFAMCAEIDAQVAVRRYAPAN